MMDDVLSGIDFSVPPIPASWSGVEQVRAIARSGSTVTSPAGSEFTPWAEMPNVDDYDFEGFGEDSEGDLTDDAGWCEIPDVDGFVREIDECTTRLLKGPGPSASSSGLGSWVERAPRVCT
jgi:hypothetical protein